MTKQASLKVEDKEVTFPVMEGTLGPDVIDIRTLLKETGTFTFDPGSSVVSVVTLTLWR